MMGALVATAALVLTSVAFPGGGLIPKTYTCDGRNLSPPLRWTAPPRRTRSFALSVEDPDAPGGTFAHWTAWNIGPTIRQLARGEHAPAEGTNSAGSRGYIGPCPPAGAAHHYVFRLYALRSRLPLANGARPAAFRRALRGRVLALARLVGRYRR